MSHYIKWVALETERNTADPLLADHELKRFNQLAANSIKNLLSKDRKLVLRKDASHITFLYDRWANSLGFKSTNDYLISVIKTPKQAEDFIMSYMNIWSGSNGRHYSNFENANYEYMSRVVNPDHLLHILKKKHKKLAADTKWKSLPRDEWSADKAETNQTLRSIVAIQFAALHNRHKKDAPTDDQSKAS